jgi:hypothetical protein
MRGTLSATLKLPDDVRDTFRKSIEERDSFSRVVDSEDTVTIIFEMMA